MNKILIEDDIDLRNKDIIANYTKNSITAFTRTYDKDSSFEYVYNDMLVKIFHIIDKKTLLIIPIKNIKEGVRKNKLMLFLFQIGDNLYEWLYNENDVMINFVYNEKEKDPKYMMIKFEKLSLYNSI